MRQAGLFGLSDHLKRLSAHGDPLEELSRIIDFGTFRPVLVAAQNNVSDARMEYLIRDRLSWLRFLGFDLGAPTPDANTIRLFREKLTEAGALDAVFTDFDRQLKDRGDLAMGGQIVDATLVAAPKPRNTEPEKAAIKEGKTAAEIWPDEPARAAQKDTDARWTLKFAKNRPAADGKPQIDIAIPSVGYKSSIAICRAFRFIRKGKITDGACFDGRMLRDVVTGDNTAADVWTDTAYRSQANEKWLTAQGRVSRIHRKKPRGKSMPDHVRRGNATTSKVRARVEHAFAQQKAKMGLFIRTIGIKRAEAKITLANLAYNMNRLIFLERRAAMG